MRDGFQPRRTLVRSVTWLALTTLVGCSSATTTEIDYTPNNTCALGHSATLTITGAPGALAATGTCGSALNVQGDLMSVSFFTTTSNPVASFTLGRIPASYTISAANKSTVSFYYGVDNQSGFCATPSGTILAIELAPSDDPAKGRAEGQFNNIALCSSSGALVYTVSGTFKNQ